MLHLLKVYAEEKCLEEQLKVYFEKSNTPYYTRIRFYTYLYVAQNSSSMYPYAVQDCLAVKLVKRFFPDLKDLSIANNPDTENLADNILYPYLARISLEDTNKATFSSDRWPKYIPDSTQQIAKWISWSTPTPQAPPPLASNNYQGWKEQFDQLKTIRKNLTNEQKELLKTWVGKHGKEYEWRVMANQYMEKHNTDESKVFLVRATLMMGLYDGLIAEMQAKYLYCIPRPYMMNPSFKPIIPKLNSPSYPSGHAIIGAIFASILSHFFPEDTTYWNDLDKEGSHSRLWAGVHFPEDIEQGYILGKKVANQILKLQAENAKCSDALQEQLQGVF